MRVLATAASKHGATAEIAANIGAELERHGLSVTVARPTDLATLDSFDAAVVGSAIYEGRWLREARTFIQVHAIGLQRMPVWLFSSGPLGDPLKPDAATVDVSSYTKGIRVFDHRVFAGRLVKHDLGFADRAMATAFRAPDGDYRPWRDIEAWAAEIADRLRSTAIPWKGDFHTLSESAT